MPKIVVVEDEEVLRQLIVGELEKKGFEVFSAKNGQLGWELIQKEDPAVILLDLLMPVMDGYAVLEELRKDEKFKDTPCIVISNSGHADDLNRAYSLGANDVLIKAEFNPDQVANKVEQLLAKQESSQE